MNKFSSKIAHESLLPPEGFLYIPQDNYYLADLAQVPKNEPIEYLYSDGATSCIIVIVEGQSRAKTPLVALAHLSKKESFHAFFELVNQHFVEDIVVYAQGANPPEEHKNESQQKDPEELEEDQQDSYNNTQIIQQWVIQHSSIVESKGFYIREQVLALGKGHPLEANRDCLGINLQTRQVSNQRFTLTTKQRDEYDGLQTLFSLFGHELAPPLYLRSVDQPFTQEQIITLLYLAHGYDWTNILSLDDEDMLYYFSTTPDCEVPWFCESLRQSALYVQKHLHLIL